MDGGAWWAAVHGVAKSWTRLSNFTFTFHFPALEKEMATHCSVLAWRIPGTGEPGGLPSMGSHRVRHDWRDLPVAAADISGTRKWWNNRVMSGSPRNWNQGRESRRELYLCCCCFSLFLLRELCVSFICYSFCIHNFSKWISTVSMTNILKT